MNTFTKSIILVLLLSAGFAPLKAQDFSYIQLIHNAADPALDTIDVYFVGGPSENNPYTAFDSNFAYHGASGMNQYPTDSPFTIKIYKKHSDGEESSLIDSVYYPANTIGANERRAFIISGVLDTTAFAVNPEYRDRSLSIQQVGNLDSIALDTSTVLLDTAFVSARFFQGVTDLPAVNIKFRNGEQVFPYQDSLKYGDNAPDISLRHGYYEFQVMSADTSQNFGTYSANFSGLGGEPVVIMCSGLVNINTTDSTSAFGLYAVLSNGGVIQLPLEASGFQLLHNSADTAADSLDVYVNGTKSFSNLPFRNATPALVFKAYATYNIAIARKNSGSVIWDQKFYFPRDTFFIATTSGLLSQTGYAANPDGISTAFNVLIKPAAEFESSSQQNFDFYMINGVTDAPALDLLPQGGPYLLTDVEYADQTNYVSLPAEFYDLDVQDTLGNTLQSGFANFQAFQSQSAVLLTSGFLNPADNNNGPGMGLYMVTTSGGAFIPLYTPSGIRKVDEATALSVFPNPASSELHVLFTLPQPERVSIAITDMNGKLIKQVLTNTNLSNAQNIMVDLNGLAEGLYFARLVTADGASNCRFAMVR